MDEQEFPAGRVLDARVHEQVFGLQPYAGEGYAADLPFYSTDLADSWRVAERLGALGYRIDSHTWTGGLASITLRSPLDEEETFHGDTPAVALCRAALAAVRPGDTGGE